MEIVVEVTQNWISGSAKQNQGPNLAVFFSILLRLFSPPKFAQWEKSETYFLGQICYNFMGVIYYKYRLCIRVNLEIEGAETRV